MKEYYEAQGIPLNDARLRMALLPEGSKVLWTEGLWVPLAVIKNIYILPGIPKLFERMLKAHEHEFKGGVPQTRVIIYTQSAEGDIAKALTEAQNAFPDVAIGSYPADGIVYRVKVTFEGNDSQRVHQVASQVEIAIKGFRID